MNMNESAPQRGRVLQLRRVQSTTPVTPEVVNPATPLPQPSPETITVKQLIDLFEQHHISQQKDPRSLRCLIRKHFGPLHDRRLASLTVLDVVAWGNEIRKGAVSRGDAAIKLLRCMINRAIDWQLFDGVNVAQRAKISGRRKRSTYIREQEMPKAMNAIMTARYPERLFFATLLILAPRPKELEFMKVQDVSIWKTAEGWAGEWKKPDFRTKKNREHIVPLPPKLAEMFIDWQKVRSTETDWMFPRRNDTKKPVSKEGWYNRWDALRIKAGLEHIWIYDLRRSGSTWAVDTSGNLAAVSKGMLDHSDYKATAHYVQVMTNAISKVVTAHESRLFSCATPAKAIGDGRPNNPEPLIPSAPAMPVPTTTPAPLHAATVPVPTQAEEQEWPG